MNVCWPKGTLVNTLTTRRLINFKGCVVLLRNMKMIISTRIKPFISSFWDGLYEPSENHVESVTWMIRLRS